MDSQPRSITKYHVMFDAAVLAVSAAAAVEALEFQRLARIFPLAAASLATVFALTVLAIDARAYMRGISATAPLVLAEPEDEVSTRRLLIVGLWMLGYVAGIALVGLPAATIVFLMGSLIVEAKLPLWKAAALTALLMVWVFLLADLLGLRMPPSLIDVFGLLAGYVT